MKRVINWILGIILIILLPIYIAGAIWVLGGEFLTWAYNNWITAFILVIVLLQSRQIRRLEQEVKRLWDERQQPAVRGLEAHGYESETR